MAKNDFRKLIDVMDGATAGFEQAAATSERYIYNETLRLIKDIELTKDGAVKPTTANLKLVSQIRLKLAKIVGNKDYQKAVRAFADTFDTIYKGQLAYFHTLGTIKSDKKHTFVKQLAAENTIDGLAGAGLQANVTNKLNDILLRAVTSGAKFSDLTGELHEFLNNTDKGSGALSRYANTYATTAMTQYAGQNNKIFTDDLGCEWFQYVGSNIETTREFCEHLTAKEYIHKSEIPKILQGEIDDHQCEIYEKTGLPKGLIDGTTPENFQVNVGGWNCRHQLVPIAKEAVPAEIRAKFERAAEKQSEQQIEIEKCIRPNGKISVVEDDLEHTKIEYNPVQDLTKILSQNEIIKRVGGGDKTDGSCSSLSLAYVGNKFGFDVLDFRDGESRKFFSNPRNISAIYEGYGGRSIKSRNSLQSAIDLLQDVQEGREYILSAARHSAIVRKFNGELQYLELQSETENGWHLLNTKELYKRFGCYKSKKKGNTVYISINSIVDIDNIGNDQQFREILSYINTNENEQMKGIGGGIK